MTALSLFGSLFQSRFHCTNLLDRKELGADCVDIFYLHAAVSPLPRSSSLRLIVVIGSICAVRGDSRSRG
jgi:hypothetical protein